MLPKVPGDIADANLILFSSSLMRVGLHISKERAIAQALLIDPLRTDISSIEFQKSGSIVNTLKKRIGRLTRIGNRTLRCQFRITIRGRMICVCLQKSCPNLRYNRETFFDTL